MFYRKTYSSRYPWHIKIGYYPKKGKVDLRSTCGIRMYSPLLCCCFSEKSQQGRKSKGYGPASQPEGAVKIKDFRCNLRFLLSLYSVLL